MIAVDTNVLVYAHRAESGRHEHALEALRQLAEGDEPWGLPVFVVGEFLRVVTHPRVHMPPTGRAEAVATVDALLASPTARLLVPGPRFWPLLQDTLADGAATGNLVFDAQIVALCREHGVSRLLTEDRDFRRFTSLQVMTLPG